MAQRFNKKYREMPLKEKIMLMANPYHYYFNQNHESLEYNYICFPPRA